MSFQKLMTEIKRAVQRWEKHDYYEALVCLEKAGDQFPSQLSPEDLEKAFKALESIVHSTKIPELVASSFKSIASYHRKKPRGEWLAALASLFQQEAEKRGSIQNHIGAL